MLEALFVLGVIFAVARDHRRPAIKPGDILEIHAIGTLADQPIDGFFQVDDDGKVSLGPSYGRVAVERLSTDDAIASIDEHLRRILRDPEVMVSRATVDLAFQRLQSENRWLQAQLPPSLSQRSSITEPIAGPTIVLPPVYDREFYAPRDALINDLPSHQREIDARLLFDALPPASAPQTDIPHE